MKQSEINDSKFIEVLESRIKMYMGIINTLKKENEELVEKYNNLSIKSNELLKEQHGKYILQKDVVNHLTSDNERLRKAVHGIYQTFKEKALNFIMASKIEREQIEIFNNIFSNFLN